MNIVFDVDGTICFNGQYIEDELSNQITALQQKHNIIFASARPIRDLISVVKNFNSRLLIGGNGSIVQNDDGIEVVQSIDAASFVIIKNLIHRYHLKYIVDDDFNYASNLSSDYKIYKQLDPDHLAKNIELEEISTPIKIILIDIPSNNYPLLKKHIEKLSDQLSINFHDNDRNIDITAENINKYTTLIKYLRNEDYIAFGNDVNDIQLLNHAVKAYFVGTKDNQIALNLQHLNLIEADTQLITQNIGKSLLN